MTRPALSALLDGRAALSPDMPIRIEKGFGPKVDTLLRVQTAYEIAEARDREGDIKVKRYVPNQPPPTTRPTLAHGSATGDFQRLSVATASAPPALRPASITAARWSTSLLLITTATTFSTSCPFAPASSSDRHLVRTR